MPEPLRVRKAVDEDAQGIVNVMQEVASERVHSAIDRAWTIEERDAI